MLEGSGAIPQGLASSRRGPGLRHHRTATHSGPSCPKAQIIPLAAHIQACTPELTGGQQWDNCSSHTWAVGAPTAPGFFSHLSTETGVLLTSGTSQASWPHPSFIGVRKTPVEPTDLSGWLPSLNPSLLGDGDRLI